jgi:hypothetical protein
MTSAAGRLGDGSLAALQGAAGGRRGGEEEEEEEEGWMTPVVTFSHP